MSGQDGMMKRCFLVVCLLGGFLSVFARAGVEFSDAGKLEIYDFPTQTGTVARRVFRNEEARATKEIYYHSNATHPKDESELVPSEVRISCRDEANREWWTGRYSAGGELQQTRECAYEEEPGALRKIETIRGAGGVREMKVIRYGKILGRDNGVKYTRSSQLHFDDTGERMIGIYGMMPKEEDLANGWGPEVDGLKGGAGVDRAEGKIEEMKVYVTVRNVDSEAHEFVTGRQYQEVEFEMRDAAGKVVPQNVEYVRRRDQYLKDANRQWGGENAQNLPPDECYANAYELREWYGKLAPGTYTLQARRRGSGKEFSVVCPGVTLMVVGGQP